MNDFQQLLLLSYIEEIGSNFSYYEFANRTGISIKEVEKMIDFAVYDRRVRNGLDSIFYELTAKGKNLLLESGVIFYHSRDIEMDEGTPEKWSIEDPYVPKDFLRKLL